MTPIRLNEHKGSAIRGALFEALRGSDHPRANWSGFCANKAAASCALCPINGLCPVMRLVSTLDESGARGHQAPRPYVIKPPLDERRLVYGPGDGFAFDLLLAGSAGDLLPYVVLALDRLAYEGIGALIPQPGGGARRGQARIVRIDAVHPLTGECAPVLRPDSRRVEAPRLPVTHAHVQRCADRLPRSGQLRMFFITPMRLIQDERTVNIPYFRPLFQRLLERIKSLVENFSGDAAPFEIRTLRDAADKVALVEDHTSWLDLQGYSTRLRRPQMIGGLVGWATYQCADWEPFLPWLIWGSLLHAGKNAVKGDGWFGFELGGERVGLPGYVMEGVRNDGHPTPGR
jgi:hypothetical protein